MKNDQHSKLNNQNFIINRFNSDKRHLKLNQLLKEFYSDFSIQQNSNLKVKTINPNTNGNNQY